MSRARLLAMITLAALAGGCDQQPGGWSDDTGAWDGGQPDRRRPRGDGGADLLRGDGGLQRDGPYIDPQQDSDGDSLPDGFEILFAGFNKGLADTDGDKVLDADEDEDGDGIPARAEWAAWQGSAASGGKPSPLHKDLFVELDYQQSAAPTSALLQAAVQAFAAVDLTNPDGVRGINLHVFFDEQGLPDTAMQSGLSARLDYLGGHGPKNISGAHVAEMVHVILATDRPDEPNRGGDTIASSSVSAEKAGVLLYLGNLRKLFPTCTNPDPPQVSVDEALLSTFVHELGHTLQLGHDTEAGGGVNAYNIMSTDMGKCEQLKERTRGIGNSDPALGATQASGGPRFSRAAAALMKLRNKLSVEANAFETAGGYEM